MREINIESVKAADAKGTQVTCTSAVVSAAISEHGVAIRAVPVDAKGNRYEDKAIRIAARRGQYKNLEDALAEIVEGMVQERQRVEAAREDVRL